MKFILGMLLLVVACVPANADILRLRDGRMFTGNFLGATRTEIWFQHDTPGAFIGSAAYPIEQVESLTFGPAMRQSNASASIEKFPLKLPFQLVDKPWAAPRHTHLSDSLP